MLSNTALTWILVILITIFAFSCLFLFVLDYFTWKEWKDVKALTAELEVEINYWANNNLPDETSDRIFRKVEQQLRMHSTEKEAFFPTWLADYPNASRREGTDVNSGVRDELAEWRRKKEEDQGPEI